jgi:hypothetical protein
LKIRGCKKMVKNDKPTVTDLRLAEAFLIGKIPKDACIHNKVLLQK